jgi:hypothetical protein
MGMVRLVGFLGSPGRSSPKPHTGLQHWISALNTPEVSLYLHELGQVTNLVTLIFRMETMPQTQTQMSEWRESPVVVRK